MKDKYRKKRLTKIQSKNKIRKNKYSCFISYLKRLEERGLEYENNSWPMPQKNW